MTRVLTYLALATTVAVSACSGEQPTSSKDAPAVPPDDAIVYDCTQWADVGRRLALIRDAGRPISDGITDFKSTALGKVIERKVTDPKEEGSIDDLSKRVFYEWVQMPPAQIAAIFYDNCPRVVTPEAKASQAISEGYYISGAVSLLRTDIKSGLIPKNRFSGKGTLTNLTPDYLAVLSDGWSGTAEQGYASKPAASAAVCDAVNTRAGLKTRPTDILSAGVAEYGCTGPDPGVIFYRFK